MLTVVQDDQERPPGQVTDDELYGRARRKGGGEAGYGRPESAGHRRRNALGFGNAGQVDEPGPVSVLFAERGGRLQRKAGLAHSTGTDQGHQPARADNLLQFF